MQVTFINFGKLHQTNVQAWVSAYGLLILTFNIAATMKLCFVTVGATAPFGKLLKAVLNSEFLETLAKRQYTDLLIQYGEDGEKIYEDFLVSGMSCHGIRLRGFGFKRSIEQDMIMTTGREAKGQKRGLIVCHAGMNFYLNDRSLWSRSI